MHLQSSMVVVHKSVDFACIKGAPGGIHTFIIMHRLINAECKDLLKTIREADIDNDGIYKNVCRYIALHKHTTVCNNITGCTPLMHAVSDSNPKLVRLLMEIDPEQVLESTFAMHPYKRNTPLVKFIPLTLAIPSKEEIVRLLLQYKPRDQVLALGVAQQLGVRMNTISSKTLNLILDHCDGDYKLNILRIALEFDVNSPGSFKLVLDRCDVPVDATVLMTAATKFQSSPEIFKMLLDRCSDSVVSAARNDGSTALTIAAEFQSTVKIIDILLDCYTPSDIVCVLKEKKIQWKCIKSLYFANNIILRVQDHLTELPDDIKSTLYGFAVSVHAHASIVSKLDRSSKKPRLM